MVEEVEELGEGAIALPQTLHDQRGVVPWQGTLRAGEAHVADDHVRRPIVLAGFKVEDLARRERERRLDAEADRLASPEGRRARRPRARLRTAPAAAPRLEEPEAVRLQEEPLAQSRICSPARGGHRLTSSSSGGMRATIWLKELIDT